MPWPHGGFGDADYLAVWENILMPVAHEFNPDMVLISAGFDSGKKYIPRPMYFHKNDMLLQSLLVVVYS